VARALGLDPDTVVDLSANLNPFGPHVSALAVALLQRDPSALSTYPDPEDATGRLAEAIGVDPRRLVLTNGGAEAIAVLARLLPVGWVEEPEFSLYRRHLAAVEPGAPRWRSNPSNPAGTLAAPDERAAVWDEAYYPLATGRWSRHDAGAWRLGSLTKLWSCPGLRLGYVIAPDVPAADTVRTTQPDWAVNGLALGLIGDLLDHTDLVGWAAAIGELRERFALALESLGYTVRRTACPWLLLQRVPGLRERLAPLGVVVRDCTSYGWPDTARVGLPSAGQFERALAAFAAVHPR
jgi:histidinol-phosphate/aromatic aminotransferase/cobyric acid decarboxylase-like protein